MKRLVTTIALIASVIAFCGCSRRVENGYKTIAYVNALLTDSLPGLRALAGINGKPSGAVVLVGAPSVCLRLSERMMICDEFDNIDARKSSDGLPDFAGETIVSLLDFTRTPDSTVALTNDGIAELRRIAVGSALAALRNPSGCKVLIICSPALSEYGGEDVADLFSRIGCEVPVLHSADTTFSFPEACFRTMRERKLFTHNISYPSAKLFITVRDSMNVPVAVRPFVDSLVPASFPDTVGVLAPNTYYSYVVQNQH